MSTSLLKQIMERPPERNSELTELVDIINSGYLAKYKTEHKKKKSFSPSTLVYGHGACPRFWNYAFSGAEFESDVDAYAAANMQAGTDAHARIQKAMTDSGLPVEHEQKVVHDDPPIFGFSDTFIVWKDKDVVIEIKTMREEAFAYRKQFNKAPTYHIEQLILYMKIKKVSQGILLYESKNSHELHAIAVEITPEYIAWVDNAFEWMRQVRQAWEDNKLPKRPYRSNSKICKKCPVKQTCFADKTKPGISIKPLEHLG